LLRRHYWSYLRTPALPVEHAPARDGGETAAQRAFSSAYLQQIAEVQDGNAGRRGVRLTYRPLGKNLRLLGTAVRRHADAGHATAIERDGPRDEIEALASRGHAWQPWLWSRTGDHAADARLAGDAAAAWREMFEWPPPSTAHGSHGRAAETGGGRISGDVARILKLAAATRFVFHPVASIEADIAARKRGIGWPAAGTPVLGMHVRRSDAASSDASGPVRSVRPSFPLSAYLDAADRLCAAYGIRHIFMASESAVEIDRARELRPQYAFLSMSYDRALFPDIASDARYIEQLALDDPGRARALALTAIMDLRMFCECDAFVGAFNSEFSVLAWLLATGSRGHLLPSVSLSRPSRGIAWHPHDALLNVANNCPLELYHW
jgi:hypothetical protein